MSSSAITGPVLSDVRRAPSGTAAAPSFAFNDSTGTGVYLVSAGVLGLSTAGVQRVVVDASGNVGIGTASPTLLNYGRELSVSSTTGAQPEAFVCIQGAKTSDGNVGGLLFFNSAASLGSIAGVRTGANNSGAITFATASAGTIAERMRIDASGNLSVGNSNSFSFKGAFYSSGLTLLAYRTTSTATDVVFQITSDVGGVGATKLTIAADGTVRNGNGVYGTLSDIKLKENIVDATPKLNPLMQVRVVNYNLIGQEQKQIGVIAQELEQIFPGMVDSTPDRDIEGNDLGTTTKSVKYSIFVPMLIKAMQELSAKNDALEARLAALENK